jgi:hypothetical protein
MGRSRVPLLIAAVAVAGCAGRGSVCTMPAGSARWPSLVDASQCGGEDGTVTYRSSTPPEQRREVEVFTAILGAAPGGRATVESLASLVGEIGMRLIVDDRFATIVEDDAKRRGRGVYVIALGAAPRELLIQIPHSFSDIYTLPLGRELFEASGARAIEFSTLHRRGIAGFGDIDNRVPPRGHADVAHDPESTFQSFTMAWIATQRPQSLAVQLHGFADHRVDADIVVSAGSKSPAAPWVIAVRDELQQMLPGRVIAAYPNDVDDLGATTNSQGRALRAAQQRFLHVEMSGSLRQSLRRRSGDRARYIAGLAKALRTDEQAAPARSAEPAPPATTSSEPPAAQP